MLVDSAFQLLYPACAPTGQPKTLAKVRDMAERLGLAMIGAWPTSGVHGERAEIMHLELEGDHGDACVWIKRSLLSQ